MKKIIEKYNQTRPLYRFFINAFFLFLLWFVFFKIIKKTIFFDYYYEVGVFWFSEFQLKLSDLILKIIGYKTEIVGKIIKIAGSYGVHLDKGCLGRNTIGLYVGFLLAYPSKNFLSKIWFSFLGILVFIILNILRIVSLAIVDNCCRQALDFNHHFTFTAVIYFVIFLLWVFWIKKYGINSKENSTKEK